MNFHKAVEESQAVTADARRLIAGSPEQEAVWDSLLHGTEHIVVNSVAGSGKSFVLVQGILRLRDSGLRIAVMAHNKHIAVALNDKLRAAGVTYATAYTYNSFGWRACIRAFSPTLEQFKTADIIKGVVEDRYGWDNLSREQQTEVGGSIRTLVGLCRSYLLDGKDVAALEALADKHNLTLNGNASIITDCVPRVLKACADNTAIMDFDDQIWQPVTKRLAVDHFDILMTDESQDLNAAKQELAMMACPKGRVVLVGDSRQAIYGWLGADAESMAGMQTRLEATERGCVALPLTVTRRCPKSHVTLAQQIVPQIKAMDDAPAGMIDYLAEETAVKQMRPGDLVLCRTNAPLVGACFQLIKMNRKAIIRGRDIGQNLKQIIDKLRAGENIGNLLENLAEYQSKEIVKLSRLGSRGSGKVQGLQDRAACIVALCDGVNSIAALKQKIDRIFADFEDDGTPRDAVVLGSVHRTKGLEATTVFVLHPEIMPHPMAQQAWEQTQESNLVYVAVTRAKYDQAAGKCGRLVFVQNEKSNGLPAYFSGQKPQEYEDGRLDYRNELRPYNEEGGV